LELSREVNLQSHSIWAMSSDLFDCNDAVRLATPNPENVILLKNMSFSLRQERFLSFVYSMSIL
jgi:hypothetical protein